MTRTQPVIRFAHHKPLWLRTEGVRTELLDELTSQAWVTLPKVTQQPLVLALEHLDRE